MRSTHLVTWLGFAVFTAGSASVWADDTSVPSLEQLASNPDLFLRLADQALAWEVPAEPFHIAGPLYFVGTKGLGCYLFKTSQGLLLLNSGMPGSGPMIEHSIETLGMRPRDIKIILTAHGHIDHVGGTAYLQRLSAAKVYAMAPDVAVMQSGGSSDFFYGKVASFHYPPITQVESLHDGDVIRLGELSVTAYHTPGHSRGSATYVMHITDHGKTYTVVFPDGAGLNPGYRVVVNPSYPGIRDSYTATLAKLASLKPDIWLTAHNDNFDLAGKADRAKREGAAAWVDPDGYSKWLAAQKAAFEQEIQQEAK